MTKAARTRQFIIEKTAPIFNCKGYDGTSLSDLTDATGLSKGAIYGNFRDKDEIASEAFLYAIEKVRATARLKLDECLSYKDRLISLLDFYAAYVFNPPIKGGCPLLNHAVEIDDHHPEMRKVVVKELLRTISFITELIGLGIEAGEFKKDTDARRIAYVIFCSIEGALMFSRAEKSIEPMDIIVKHCKDIIQQISK
ncbi:MAG TPA: TetR/AcrR family transcriptional regulator [Chryseosolibacter sp.]|nr:TetR/AcrR family transcriptional regulator [Chryseosolibacter sp.]